jgi:hypothetical protein
MDDEEPNANMRKYTVTRSLIQPTLSINKPHEKQARAHKNITNVHQEPCARQKRALWIPRIFKYCQR